MEEELKETKATPAQPAQEKEQKPAETAQEPAASPEGAITPESVMKLIAEAEKRGFERGKAAGAEEERENARKCGSGSIWEDTRLTEAENEQRRSRLQIDDEFLTRLRPTAWD